MGIKQLYEKFREKHRQLVAYKFNKSKESYPLYTHGTYLKKLDDIWRTELKPSGDVPANDIFTVPGYVSLSEANAALGSGHGDILLIIDGKELVPTKIEFCERYRHPIHKGPINKQAIIAILPNDLDSAKQIYQITDYFIPVIDKRDKLILSQTSR